MFAVPRLIEVEFVVEGSLIQKGQQHDAPAQAVDWHIFFADPVQSRKPILRVMKIVKGQADLLHVIAGDIPGGSILLQLCADGQQLLLDLRINLR